MRGVAIEWRGKIDDDRWRRRWDTAIIFGSAVPALLWGVAFGNIVRGLRVEHYRAGPFSVLLHAFTPYALLGGLTTVTLFLLHGAVFLALKTRDDLRERAVRTRRELSIPTARRRRGLGGLDPAGLRQDLDVGAVLVAAVCLVGVVLAARAAREGRASR